MCSWDKYQLCTAPHLNTSQKQKSRHSHSLIDSKYISETTTVFSQPEPGFAHFRSFTLLVKCVSCFTILALICSHSNFQYSLIYYTFWNWAFFVNLHQLLHDLLLLFQHIPSKRLNYDNRFVHIVKTSGLADDHDPQVWWLRYYPIKNWPQLSKQVCKKTFQTDLVAAAMCFDSFPLIICN